MPFLRRRGNVGTESDLRPQSSLVDGPVPQDPRLSESNKSTRPGTSQTTIPPATPTILEPPLEASRSADQVDATSQDGTERFSSSRPGTPPVQEDTPRTKRFSVLKFRNASDSQLSLRARQQAEKPPPVPRPPDIITTAPTLEIPHKATRKASKVRLTDRFRKSSDLPRSFEDRAPAKKPTWGRRTSGLEELAARSRPSLVTFEEPRGETSPSKTPPTIPDNDSVATAPTPTHRASESSRSETSLSPAHANSPTPTKHSASAAASLFRLPRKRNKSAVPLFDLSHLPQKGKQSNGMGDSAVSGSSLDMGHSHSSRPQYSSRPPSAYSNRADSITSSVAAGEPPSKPLSPSPATAYFRPGSTHSGRSSPSRARLQLRDRSSTMSSMGRDSMDDHLQPNTTRTSSSTGRKSLGDLFSLNRLRQNPELAQAARQGTLTPATPGSNNSKNNSLQIAREPIALPARLDDENAAKYLTRIEQSMSRGVIASALCKPTDPFFATVLRSYMRRFSFFGDPMDMAIRKLLMEAELPKETQQIDRCLQGFANRYHECNPGIYSSPDQAYFIAFSLLILHTDVFNKNNKYKMQQNDYIKNTRDEGVSEPILKCFYDNITYTPFIHVEDDVDLHGDRQRAKRKNIFPGGTPDAMHKKSSKEPLDPYTIILDNKLDMLRPSLKDVMELEDHYDYMGTAKTLDLSELRRTFFRTGVLQIVSARSRPDAFRDEKSTTNPDTAPQGVVDIKVTKVGLLWRKDAKKKRARSPWQEWGAILTGAQLYFFRNTNWVKSLMHQYDYHVREGYEGEPITFKPALAEFKPDAFMPIKDAVALVDSAYKRHKHAFNYSRPGAFVEEVLLADNEEEMNDWLAKLNYAAAFTTSGVRMRGLVGGNYEGQSRRGIRRLSNASTAQVIQTPTGDVTVVRGKIDHKEAESILMQRHETMVTVVAKAAEDIAAKEKDLEQILRNARHLQILAPIQQKTRDELLREAARMDVKIKWIRMEIWKIKCHRDVLAKDLEGEGIMVHLSPAISQPSREPGDSSSGPNMLSVHAQDTKLNGGQNSHHASSAASTSQTASPPAQAEAASPVAEEFQTPPTSATHAQHRHQQSWDSSMSGGLASRRARSASYATTSSLVHDTPASARFDTLDTAEPGKEQVAGASVERQHSDDADANERDLLEQAGLLESPSRHPLGAGHRGSVSEADASEHNETIGGAGEKPDRTKVRRSLQRTLRESAGHLSHHRSRRGKDLASSDRAMEDNARDDMLSRGTGSFVVHGKKASVIDFGEGLQQMPVDERLRQKLQLGRDEPLSPSSVEEDFHDAVGHQPIPEGRRERRESAASGSTATARSFRELHRRISSAQTAIKISSQGGKLSIPSDTESDAAVSISEGRRSPLPPIETQVGEEDEDPEAPLPGQSRSQLVTSPGTEGSTYSPVGSEQDRHDDEQGNHEQASGSGERLSKPHMQAVRA